MIFNNKIIRIVFLVLALFSLVSAVFAHETEDRFFHYGMMGTIGTTWGFVGMWLFGIIIAILVITALVLLILWLIKQINKK